VVGGVAGEVDAWHPHAGAGRQLVVVGVAERLDQRPRPEAGAAGAEHHDAIHLAAQPGGGRQDAAEVAGLALAAVGVERLLRQLREPNSTKIVLLVADGLGGLPLEPGGKTELETARTPNLDALAREGVCGLSVPVLPGITPGSGPGHLGLFGYDPLEHRIGRGILEALGINFPVGPNDICVRGNFVTLGPDGKITDRRAGRPSTQRCTEMVKKLRAVTVPGCELFVEPVKEHRFVLVLRAAGLGDAVNDTDPQATSQVPLLA